MRHPSPFADTVAVLEEVFRPCLVMGQVVRAHRRAPSRASDPFPATVCDCGEERSRFVSLKEAWRPTTPHGREGFILAPCKAGPRAFFPSGSIHGSRARFGGFSLNRVQGCEITGA